MKRKLVRQGNNALTLTLPSDWLKRYNLKAGEEIFIKENEQDLIIKATPHPEEKIVDVNLDIYKDILQKYLQSLYRQGISEVHAKYSDAQTIKKIHGVLSKNMIGYEIVEQGDNKVIIKSIADVNEESFDAIFRRIFRINESMLKFLFEIIKETKKENIDSAILLEETNNKLTNFCRRTISKRLYEGQEIVLIYSVIEILERMADEIRFALEHLKTSKTITKNEKQLAKDAYEFFKLCHDAYFTQDFQSFVKEGVKRKDLIEDSLKIFHNSTQKDFYIMHYLVNIVQQTAHILTYRLQIFFLTTKK